MNYLILFIKKGNLLFIDNRVAFEKTLNLNTGAWLSQALFLLSKIKRSLRKFTGGSVWESNPPCPLLAGNTGFEVQEGHQNPMYSHRIEM